MAEKLIAQPEAPQQPAIDFLNYIQSLKFRKNTKPETIRAFFKDMNLGGWVSAIVQTYGEENRFTGGYTQLRGGDDEQIFLATYYPGSTGEKPKADATHVYYGRPGQHEDTSALTFVVGSGLPLAQRTEVLDRFGRSRLQKVEDSYEIFEEVQRFAALLTASLSAETAVEIDQELAA